MSNEKISGTSINWFPGHMAKTEKQLKEDLKKVDIVAEIVDARIPRSSRNPDLNFIIADKPRILVINKSDLSDSVQNQNWSNYLKNIGVHNCLFSSKNNKSSSVFRSKVKEVLKDKINSWKRKGILNQNIKVMVVGIPNVGKSTFINKLSKNSKAKVENRPGVTRKNQWFFAGNNIEILDTPGVLWPKFESREVAYNLAFTGAIKDEILDREDLASNLLTILYKNYKNNLIDRYKLDENTASEMDGYELLKYVGKKRGMVISGGEIDTLRAANMVLDEFRSGKLGRISLEIPK
ncbi:MAG: ribosome biogenesis GTPase YlqF [Acutalibacteraceae bacterium]